MSETENQNTNTTNQENTGENQERVFEYDGQRFEVEENFWDKEKNGVNVGALLKSQQDLRKQISAADASPKDGYACNIPEEYKDILEAAPNSPLWKVATAWAKEHKISQEAFDELAKPYFDELAAPLKNRKEDLQNEEEKLTKIYGNRVSEVKDRIKKFVKNSGLEKDPEVVFELSLLTQTAAGVRALDTLIKNAPQGMTMIGTGSGGTEPTEYSKEQLQAMMKDPRYWRDHEPNFVKVIENGFKKLYGE